MKGFVLEGGNIQLSFRLICQVSEYSRLIVIIHDRKFAYIVTCLMDNLRGHYMLIDNGLILVNI